MEATSTGASAKTLKLAKTSSSTTTKAITTRRSQAGAREEEPTETENDSTFACFLTLILETYSKLTLKFNVCKLCGNV